MKLLPHQVNTHTFPTSFFIAYLDLNNRKISDLNFNNNLEAWQKRNLELMLINSPVLNISDLQSLLHSFDLHYDQFVGAYCEYLKSLA